MNQYKEIKIKNKSKIIIAPILGSQTATALFMFKTGSHNESRENSGISHFLEHMFFKGTKKRPSTLQISSELDSLGCEFNAFTGKEYTGYWVKTAADKIDQALEILSDMLLNSQFKEEEIKRERGVIIEELNMYEDNPLMQISDILEICLFGDSSAGRKIIGSKKNIKSFTRKNFLDYYRQQYGNNSGQLSLVGNIKEKTITLAQDVLKKFPDNKMNLTEKINIKQTKPKTLIIHKDIDQVNIALAVRAFPRNHQEELRVDLLATILGGAMSSRLFINLRERNGLAYYVKTGTEAYEQAGYLSTQAGVPAKQSKKAIQIILEEYKKLTQELVGQDELQRAKDIVRGRLLLYLEASDNLALWYASQHLLESNHLSPQEFLREIDKITASELQETAQKIFINQNLNLAAIGRLQKDEFKDILQF